MTSSLILQLKDISVTFNPGDILEAHALKNISIDIHKEQYITIIGSNGAGKSTLLNAVAGDIPITNGQILINEENITHYPAYKRASTIARVFQDPLAGTCAKLSIEENLSLALQRGRHRFLSLAINKKRQAFFREQLQDLGLHLENRLQDPVASLSGGQRQALSLVMATLSGSHILLLDEHTAALDPRMAAFVLSLTHRIQKAYHLTILMVTHSMQAALESGNRILMLHQGKIIRDIPSENLQKMQVADLLQLFTESAQSTIDNDRLLLSAS